MNTRNIHEIQKKIAKAGLTGHIECKNIDYFQRANKAQKRASEINLGKVLGYLATSEEQTINRAKRDVEVIRISISRFIFKKIVVHD